MKTTKNSKSAYSPVPFLHGPARRSACEHDLAKWIDVLVVKAQRAGWNREEALVAISDAADRQLIDGTAGLSIRAVPAAF